MNPTQQQLDARLNPTSYTINTPTNSGLFRGVGGFGDTIFSGGQNGGHGTAYNLTGNDSPLFKDFTDRASFGNAGGQAAEAIKRLQSQYNIDYNSLPSVNLGDYIQSQNRLGGAYSNANPQDTAGFKFNQGNLSSLGQSPQSATLGTQTLNNTPNTLAPQTQALKSNLYSGGSGYSGPSIVDFLSYAGQPNDFNSRTRLAQQSGIQNYSGTADQNTQLLNMLRGQNQSAGSGIAPTSTGGGVPVVGGAPSNTEGGVPVVGGAPSNTEGDSNSLGLEQAFINSLRPSSSETSIQDQIDRLMAGTAQGVANVQDQPIATSFITGQASAIERQNNAKIVPLQQRLVKEQSLRQSSMDLNKFALERSDKAREANNPKEFTPKTTPKTTPETTPKNKDTKFLTRDWLATTFGIEDNGTNWLGLDFNDGKKKLDEYEGIIKQYQEAGYTDQKILELMKKG